MIKTYKEALEKIFTYEEVRDYSLERVREAVCTFMKSFKKHKSYSYSWNKLKMKCS